MISEIEVVNLGKSPYSIRDDERLSIRRPVQFATEIVSPSAIGDLLGAATATRYAVNCPVPRRVLSRKCKFSGWIELLGCGMVDPAVFASVMEQRRKINPDDDAYNPAKISGFAFGMGVERIAMMLHGVSDIGHFYSGDMRFLEQFA